ncbi:MAG: gamma-glutamylcyclotransferase [Clostridia bacterium]|nr:gamma-glutamylcyclotransferase [Clostridia bacterium]
MDDFFKKTKCDRCHKPLAGCRIMSIYNTQVICMTCKEKEQQRTDYRKAVEADHAEIRKGNYNFQGIGLDD